MVNAVAGLHKYYGSEGGSRRSGALSENHDRGPQLDHPVAWDGSGRAQYVLACERHCVRANQTILHQLGRTRVTVDVGSLINRRLRNAAPALTHGYSEEQLNGNGASIMESLKFNSLGSDLR